MKKIDYLYVLHECFNEDEFNGKLGTIRMLISRSKHKDGEYEYHTRKRDGELYLPNRFMLPRSTITIAGRCFKDEDLLQGTVLHEMLHQYQTEVLDRPTSHDAIFTSMARRLERKYGFSVR